MALPSTRQSRAHARLAVVGLALLLGPFSGGLAAQAPDPAALQGPWRDPEAWRRTEEVLRGLELSTDLEQAKARYVDLLEAIGAAAAQEPDPMPDEAALRDYYQRAIGLQPGAGAEGMLLLRLAESWSRTQPGTGDSWRRIESLLLRAADLLTEPGAQAQVHSRLGQLYRQAEGEGNLTRAVRHFSAVVENAEAGEAMRAAAREALAELTREELVVAVEHRFLPGTEMRISARTRNLEELRVQVAAMPLPEAGPPTPCAVRRHDWSADELAPANLLLDEVQPVASRSVSDWKETAVRLGDSLLPGWYAVRLQGGSLVAEKFVLVTTLEIVALPDPSGGLAVWAGSSESAGPAAGALLWVLGEGGTVLHQAVLDPGGMAVLAPAQVAGWRELHVVAGRDTGCLCSGDIVHATAAPAWAIANAAEIPPGGALQWCVLGSGIDAGPVAAYTFHLPDGAVLTAPVSRRGPLWAAGELVIPATLEVSGPVFIDTGARGLLNLAHVRASRLLPLGLVFSGERMSDSHQLFDDSKPVTARVIPAYATRPALPDFVRLRVTELRRPALVTDGSAPAGPLPPVLEVILPLGEAMGGAVLGLPKRTGGPHLQAYRVEVLSLEQETLLAEGCLAVSAYRVYVELRQAHRIVRPGDPVALTVAPHQPGDLLQQPVDGELVVFRETWESRYIHRKRGNTISEQEYLALPERSLLGAARTDYRLAEQGYRSEEAARLPVQVGSSPLEITVPFERSGYYRIELQTRAADIWAVLPDGPLEIWVVGEPQDVRSFRSDRPRLLVEPARQGGHRVLALLASPGTSVIMGAEYADGHVAASHYSCPDPALYVELPPRAEGELAAVRLVAVGDRKTRYLCEHLARPGIGALRLGSAATFGLNPGIAFDWPVEAPADLSARPVFWTFFPEQDAAAVQQRVGWQRAWRESTREHSAEEVLSLSRRLPVQHPLDQLESAQVETAADGTGRQTDLGEFLALYPELRLSPVALRGPSPLTEPVRKQDSPAMHVQGAFPDVAGKWQLAVFALDAGDSLQTAQWLVSTELPVRASLSGPALARLGDQLLMPFAVENTTREAVRLDLQFEASGLLATGPDLPSQRLLQPGERAAMAIPAVAVASGSGRLRARFSWDGNQGEAQHAVEIQPDGAATGLRLRMAQPQLETWEQTLMLGDFADGEVVLASGLGTLLPEVWPAVRAAHQSFEPLLVALGDWALARALSHHGMTGTAAGPDAAAGLRQVLRQHESADGGWAWLPGRPANAWLSALVLGTLDTFPAPNEVLPAEMRERARAFLEQQLAGGNCPLTTQLLVLDAVQAGSMWDAQSRPTRIQARAFLDLFHERANLASFQVAILLKIARSFDFREEVAILDDELQRRITMGMPLSASSFWRLSHVYLSQVQTGKPRAQLEPILAQTLGQLEAAGPDGGWQAIGGFINLLASFLIEGDFTSEGVARVTLGDLAVDFALNPVDSGGGLHRAPLTAGQLAAGRLPVRISMKEAASPVFIAIIGPLKVVPETRPWPGLAETWFREFEQQTLLGGPQRQLEELTSDGALTLQPGDLLQIRISFENTKAADYAELVFAVPACTSLDQSSVRHTMVEGELTGVAAPPALEMARRGTLDHLLRLDSFPAGEHRIEWSMTVLWEGEYAMPAPVIFLPMNGQRFALAKAVRLRVAP